MSDDVGGLEDVPEELQPETSSDVVDTIVAALLGAALLFVYAGAAEVWPGGPAVWVAIGFAIYVAASWRVYGLPWRGPA